MSHQYIAISPPVLWQAAGADRTTFCALSQTFLDLAPSRLHLLEQALARAQPAAVRAASHALKGMTLLVGAERLSAQLQALERQAAGGVVGVPLEPLAPLLRLVLDEVALSMLQYDGAGARR